MLGGEYVVEFSYITMGLSLGACSSEARVADEMWGKMYGGFGIDDPASDLATPSKEAVERSRRRFRPYRELPGQEYTLKDYGSIL